MVSGSIFNWVIVNSALERVLVVCFKILIQNLLAAKDEES